MNNEEFYVECARLLGTEYGCEAFKWYKRTRWNNRTPGSGRYPGFGIIRVFGNEVQVSLRQPISVTKIFDSKEAVLQFLKESIP